jgi:prepilin-type N-terminal cleavage/methylation domain-containing protein
MNQKQISHKKIKNRGMTLVELIITFALLSMFMVVATMMITSTMNIYYQVKGNSYGLQVSNILHSKIAGELEGAMNGDITSTDFLDPAGQGLNGAMLISNGKIEFTDSTGSHVSLGLQETDGKKYLALHYYAVPDSDGTGNLYDAVDWCFGKDVYMGYTIDSLVFRRPMGDYGYNIIQVELTITSPKYGSYTSTKYVECYNFDDTINPARVVDVPEVE